MSLDHRNDLPFHEDEYSPAERTDRSIYRYDGNVGHGPELLYVGQTKDLATRQLAHRRYSGWHRHMTSVQAITHPEVTKAEIEEIEGYQIALRNPRYNVDRPVPRPVAMRLLIEDRQMVDRWQMALRAEAFVRHYSWRTTLPIFLALTMWLSRPTTQTDLRDTALLGFTLGVLAAGLVFACAQTVTGRFADKDRDPRVSGAPKGTFEAQVRFAEFDDLYEDYEFGDGHYRPNDDD